MTPAMEAKIRAIRLALDTAGPTTDNSHVAIMLAMLTSPAKEDREHAKSRVRAYVALGERKRKETENAADLASFANRHEP